MCFAGISLVQKAYLELLNEFYNRYRKLIVNDIESIGQLGGNVIYGHTYDTVVNITKVTRNRTTEAE